MTATGVFDRELQMHSFTWLVTGAAGFIGSHLVQKLLELNQKVVGLDNYSTGSRDNLTDVEGMVGARAWKNFSMFEMDIRDLETCKRACQGADFVLHQAALGSVPLSLHDPILTHDVNVGGFINMLIAARSANVQRFVYASSCAIYGDNSNLPLAESEQARPISPYAASKAANELYAQAFCKSYCFPIVGLRYFNVFGERQDPNGSYAAVIPRWIKCLLEGEAVRVHGDGWNTRDFVYVQNVVQANISAAMSEGCASAGVYNVAGGCPTSLNELYKLLALHASELGRVPPPKVQYGDPRAGDIIHSHASIERSLDDLDYQVTDLASGLKRAMAWYASQSIEVSYPEVIDASYLQTTIE